MMWFKEDEMGFERLIKKYKENPYQKPSDEDMRLIKRLMECYLSADIEPKSEIPFFQKLSRFYNVFFESYIQNHPSLFKDKSTFDEIVKKSPLEKTYPIFEIIKKFIEAQFEEDMEQSKDAHKDFATLMGEALSPEAKDYLDPNLHFGAVYPNPKPDPKDISTLPYKQMLQRICGDAELKMEKEKLNFGEQRDALLRGFCRQERGRALRNLNGLYSELDVTLLQRIPHILHTSKKVVRFYSDSFLGVLPHSGFAKIIKLRFQDKFPHGSPKHFLLAELVGKILIEENHFFHGYNILRKTDGKEPGFVLVSPNGERRYYAKCTENIIPEYFCSKALTGMGVKMPEARLLADEYGSLFYVTMDISRQYIKGKYVKKKNFMPFSEELREVSHVAFDFEQDSSLSEEERARIKEEQTRIVEKFVKESTTSKNSRNSFAKILLLGIAFGLSDLGGHGGNVGFIRAQKDERNYGKFGIVDFEFSPKDISEELDKDLLGYMEERLTKTIPVFKQIYNALKPEDFVAAAEELAKPKERMYNKEGFLLTSSPLTQTTFRKIIEGVFEEMIKELRDVLPPKEYQEKTKELQGNKDIMIKNLEAVIVAARKIRSEAAAEKKESHDKPPRL